MEKSKYEDMPCMMTTKCRGRRRRYLHYLDHEGEWQPDCQMPCTKDGDMYLLDATGEEVPAPPDPNAPEELLEPEPDDGDGDENSHEAKD